MSSITKQHIGKYTYLYESESYWDSEKKRPDNRKIKIGKIDLLSGEPVYKQDYLDKLKAAGHSVDGMRLWDRGREARVNIDAAPVNETHVAYEVLDSVKDFGVVYLLRELSEKIGLGGILRSELPNVWEEVFTLACYLIAADKPLMYCSEWAESNSGLGTGNMSSQRISDLLAAFGCAERSGFYGSWHKMIREREYVALDITSVSSYSGSIGACERGYNRDGEDLAQINICMLFGMDSKLPVYQTLYSGSLSDVTTLKTTISEFAAMTGGKDIMVVMDKGFYSKKNIDMLINGCGDGMQFRFLISAPFSANIAYDQIEAERGSIDRIDNVILTNGSPIRGIHKLCCWGSSMSLNVHVFFNPEKSIKERNDLYGYVTSLMRQAKADPDNKKLASAYAKYLKITRPRKNSKEVCVNIREDEVAWELETTGWFVLLSNFIDDPQVAYDTYRMKDVVEKSFMRYKQNLGLKRLRVHSDDRMQNKVFIAFIALIIASAIHETMKTKGLYKRMTFDRLFLTLAKLKAAVVNGKPILRPMTKEQVDIFKAFDIRMPDYITLKPSIPKKRGRKPKAAPAAP
ncbi:MAG: transposase [Oscillospiraceae bacterium]|nr:transposase [Oscillospiraceae bacterium]